MLTFLEAGWPAFLALFTAGMVILYLAREPAHNIIHGSFGAVYAALRLMAVTLGRSATNIRERNRDVLLNIGREHGERELRKEFHEISQFVQRDLGGYPQLQQEIREQITSIQADYEASQAAPASLPDWAEAVESVAKLKQSW